MCSSYQLCPVVRPRVAVPTSALRMCSPAPLPPAAATARARPAHGPCGGTHPRSRHRPFKSGARGRRGGGGRGRALPGTARAEGREEENKTRGRSQSWSCRRRRLELPRADNARDARTGLRAVRPGARGSYGDRERGPRRRLTGVGPRRRRRRRQCGAACTPRGARARPCPPTARHERSESVGRDRGSRGRGSATAPLPGPRCRRASRGARGCGSVRGAPDRRGSGSRELSQSAVEPRGMRGLRGREI